jgi:putative oxidoreductase
VPVTDQGRDFAGRIIAAGYLWPLMKLLVLAASILLLTNRATAFGLAMLVPITVVIVWFQSTLNPLPVPVATTFTVVICELLLIKAYASRFAGMFNDRGE